MKSTLIRWGALALMIGMLAGCGGGGGGDGGAATPAPGGGTVPGVTPPSGNAPVTVSNLTAEQFAALAPRVVVGGVAINSAPQVSFSIADANNNPIIGFGSKSQSATATVASYPNLSFSLVKLVPGAGTAPSRWVSYIVTTVPTKNATTGAITASVPTRPSTDNTGTLVDNGNGTYTYTFYRDITQVKAAVAAATLTPPNIAADLDDLTYEPNLVHRLAIQVSGNAPGTGTNTPNGVQTTPGVPMENPVNAIYDFIPATGQAVTASGREIASTAKCNECHQNLGGTPEGTVSNQDARFHGGNRNDTRYCVVCHTDQRKYGRTEAVVLADGNYDGLSTYRINGLAVGNLPTHIHKIHMSANLAKTGYYYGGVRYEEACKLPQDIRNCTKCHDGTAGAANATAQGDNWKNVPSRKACGACHDGINFATGGGITVADAERVREGLPRTDFAGHVGGARPDDSICALCHDAASIDRVYHLPVTSPNLASALHVAGGSANTNAAWIASNTSRLPTGAIKVTYEIFSVSRNASKQPVMVFRMLQNGVAVPLNVASATKTEIWDNFMGAPSAYFVFAVPQDGVTAPADFNATASGYLRSIWNGTSSGTGRGTLTGPDANNFYAVTLTGVTIPDNAVMLTGGLGYSYNVRTTLPLTQTNLADYPVSASPVAGETNRIGGLIVVAPNVQKVATGYTGRRTIVEDARCNKCHQELGVFTKESFHGGQRNDGTTCAWCHTPNRTSSGWSADSASYVHAIHAAAKREKIFSWHAASTTDGFFKIGYPGILANCETCHVPDGYDFSSAAAASALPNRLYRTVGQGIYNGTVGALTTGCTVTATNNCLATELSVFSLSPYVVKDNATNYGAGFSFSAATGVTTPAAATTLVTSPIATVCFSCHDDSLAQAHMESNGGSIYRPRSTALTKLEQCTFCHSSTSAFGLGIKAVHAR